MKMRKIIAVLAAALMLFSILPISAMAADTYELASSIAVGDTVVLAYTSGTMELNGISTTSTKYGLGVAYTTAPVGAYALTVEEGYTAGTYSFKCPNDQYLYWTSGNSLNTNATKSANTSWTVSFDGDNAIILNAKDNARKLQWNANSPRFACYTSAQTAVQLFKLVTGGTDEPECEHVWVDADCDTPKTCSVCGVTEGEALGHSYVEDIIDATCTATGTATYECSVCGHSYDEEIPMIPHDYVDGFCSVCGAEEPAISEHTIDFSTTEQRVSMSSDVQVWENGALTVTNNQAGSTSSIGNYSNPARFYKSSQIVIECAGMTSLVINASGIGSSYLWEATLNAASLTYTVNDQVYTITFAEPTDSITMTTANQVRAYSITAVAAKQEESDCEHDYVATETEPTCGAAGVITYTCSLCGDSYTEEGAPATGEHTYEGYVCSVCGAINYPADGDELTIPEATALGVAHPSNSYSENKYYVTGEITGYYGDKYATYGNVYIKDAEGNTLLIYGLYSADGSTRYDAMDVKPVIGDTITVYGVIGSFNSTAQMKNGWVVEHTAHEHAYDNDFDTDCNVCGEIRNVELPIAKVGVSASEDVRGVAAKFVLTVDGMGIDETTAIYDNAYVNDYKLISMGAVATNGVSTVDIPVEYLCDDDVSASAQFAIRIKNIPEGKEDVEITFTPYFTIEINGAPVTIYGEEVVASYNSVMG